MADKKKDSNPKDALGIKKVPLHAVPVKPLLEVGLAMMEGGRKYGTHNYRAIGVKVSTYYDAIMRHMMAWWEGEDIDPDSGVHHLVKTAADLFVVRDSMHMGNCIDNRPIQYPDGIGMEKFNKIASDLIIKYPECAKPFTMHSDIKADGPQFKAGDKVKIVFREDKFIASAIKRRCGEAGNVAEYVKKFRKNEHLVKITGYSFMVYADELTLMEDN